MPATNQPSRPSETTPSGETSGRASTFAVFVETTTALLHSPFDRLSAEPAIAPTSTAASRSARPMRRAYDAYVTAA
jgi:hypothetical protein